MNLRTVQSRMLATALVIFVQGCGSIPSNPNPDVDNETSDGAGNDPLVDPTGDDPADGTPSTFILTFTLSNQDSEDIHILLPGDSFELENRMTPGATRLGALIGVAEGTTIQLRAGRNGVVLSTATCPPASGSTMAFEATWTDTSFVCTGA